MNNQSQFVIAAIVSVFLHALLLAGITLGWESTSDPTPRVFKPRYVEAKLVELKAQDTKAPAQKKNNVIDLTKKRELEQQRAEAAKRAKEEAARQRRVERERKAKAEAKKKRDQEAERKRQQALEAKRRAEADAAKAKAERERQERIAEERLDDAMRKEEQQRQAQLAAQQTQSYVNMISSRIEQNWSRPPSARRGMKVELLIQLVPTGQVVNVTVVRSSGNAAFDRSAEQAVRRIDRFSELRNMPPTLFEENFRQLKLVFDPKDLRL
ncbi:cell envelope integrity protein TolA [Gilvimarinus agarilyticus]|uniref:cell envelope integrity protein TolA n=1 Tax=unclassified Gilvimarinus TaxID=2642066 RepID=UPI001C0810BE|nr:MULTISPECIES: cell envelope integrity protein TolA [unclassified Gilvimarinus]MBU2887378.1 cell envelope integrity protein TolA [Gilvimarinus agarilyticus]MDO6572037.1 cell envelope integrity protein TolA [Gilvimarinus sp. 2_MG-2023]MDO6746097.1 cell envelope integrity protein TolA [Gilvimarinus sp. 1_MG-2023]